MKEEINKSSWHDNVEAGKFNKPYEKGTQRKK